VHVARSQANRVAAYLACIVLRKHGGRHHLVIRGYLRPVIKESRVTRDIRQAFDEQSRVAGSLIINKPSLLLLLLLFYGYCGDLN